ncbi:MAG: glycosyltransferase [Hyphomicrobiales bacterium]|nr:glycosyltransferase [Hyphomicrobiales bacterium]
MAALTLITSVLNGMPYLDAMLSSVPPSPQTEHLAIDAGSTDGTLERLRKRDGLKLIERPGLPLYAAWNEGVREATSPWVAFLNADDELPQGALDAMLQATAGADRMDVICGEAEAISADRGVDQKAGRYVGGNTTDLSLGLLAFGAPTINAKLFRREFILQANGFDESFTFAADREFLLRLAIGHPRPKLKPISETLYRYRIHPGSSTLQQTTARRLEIAQEHRRTARRLAAWPDLDPATRTLLRSWLAHETAVMAVYGLASGRFGGVRLAVSALGRLLLSGPRVALDLARAAQIRRRLRSDHRAANAPTTPTELEE